MSTVDGKAILSGAGERPCIQERFMLGMLEIPECSRRLQVMSSLEGYKDSLADILRRIGTLRAGIKALHGSQELILFVQAAMGMGNYLGAKTKFGKELRSRQPKYGVHFDGLFKFVDIKSNSRRRTLMQALVSIFKEKILNGDAERAKFHNNLMKVVKDASSIKPDVLDMDVDRLKTSLNEVKLTLAEIPRAGGMFVDNYHATVKDYLSKYDPTPVKEAFISLYQEFESAGKFFGFDPFVFDYESTPLEVFFSDILRLFSIYEEAVVSIERQEHIAKLKADRLAKREAKMKAEAKYAEAHPEKVVNEMDKKMGKSVRRTRMPPPVKFEDEMANMLARRRKKLGLKEVR